MTGGESPRLFDRALRRRRAARWRSCFAEHDVLHAHAAELAAEKLLDVTRHFARACVWGDRGRHLSGLLPPGKIDAAVHADDLARPGAATVVADAEASPFADEAFDLVVSLLDLHAANDPIGAMIQIARSLTPDGLFVGVMFGAETLNELRIALAESEIETAGGLSPRVFPFADVRDAGSLLQRAGFALPVADEDRLTIRYADPLRLFADLRAAGESNVLTERRRVFLRRDTLSQALANYGRQFRDGGRFRATFSFLTLTGWRPHQSQPRALKPGSAQVSLVQALKDVRS